MLVAYSARKLLLNKQPFPGHPAGNHHVIGFQGIAFRVAGTAVRWNDSLANTPVVVTVPGLIVIPLVKEL